MCSCVNHRPHAGSQESIKLLHDLNSVFVRKELADSDILRTICKDKIMSLELGLMSVFQEIK